MVVIQVHFKAGLFQDLGKAGNPGGLLTINNDQAGDPVEIDIF